MLARVDVKSRRQNKWERLTPVPVVQTLVFHYIKILVDRFRVGSQGTLAGGLLHRTYEKVLQLIFNHWHYLGT